MRLKLTSNAHSNRCVRGIGLIAALLIALSASSVTMTSQAAAGKRISKNPYAGSLYQKFAESKGAQVLNVRFQDNMRIRLRKGRPVDLRGKYLKSRRAQAVFKALEKGQWRRGLNYGEKTLDRFRTQISRRARVPVPDLNLHYLFRIPKGMSMAKTIALLESLSEVRYVYPLTRYALTDAPDYTQYPGNEDLPWQKYLADRFNGGIDAFFAWQRPGGTGEGVNVVDVELAFDQTHHELAGTVHDFLDDLGNPTFDVTNQRSVDHGTSSLGVIGGDPRNPGITGIAPDSNKFFLPIRGSSEIELTLFVGDYCAGINNDTLLECADVPSTMLFPLTAEAIKPGDVMLIELQMAGPNSNSGFGTNNQFGGIPIEYSPINYDVIRTLTASGVIVVEGGGNGEQNLDDEIYRTSPHRPFVVRNGVRLYDSGAIIVGAASSGTTWANPSYLSGPTNPLTPVGIPRKYSSYGARIDVHAWGDGVVTSGGTGNGSADLYSDEGPQLHYRKSFSGTSSASAIVAGAAASLQGMYKKNVESFAPSGYSNHFLGKLYSATARRILKQTGVEQTPIDLVTPQVLEGLENSNRFNLGPANHIGERPNLRAASSLLDRTIDDLTPLCDLSTFPVPTFSAPEDQPLTRTGTHTAVGISYGATMLAAYPGWFDILYTVDGSEPDCWPRVDASCDLSRIRTVTAPMEWRYDYYMRLQNAAAPNTVKARFVIESCPIDATPVVTRVFQ